MQKDTFFKYYFLFIFWLGVGTLAFFSNETSVQEMQLSSKAFEDGIVAEDFVWTKKSIGVCWELPENFLQVTEAVVAYNTSFADTKKPLSLSDRQLVENKIREQFTIDKVGIEFVGWKDCVLNDKSEVKIFAFDEISDGENYPPGEANIGQSCEIWQPQKLEFKIEKRDALKPGYLFLNKTPLKKEKEYYQFAEISLARVALHEFGHAAGLVHEQYQSEAKKDPNCVQLAKENPNFNKLDVDLGKVTSYSKYDAVSIMNWCFTTTEDQKPEQKIEDVKLSDLDQLALKCTYKTVAEFDKKNCNARQLRYKAPKKKNKKNSYSIEDEEYN